MAPRREDSGRWPLTNDQRRKGGWLPWAGVGAVVLATVVAIWAAVGDVPILRNPFRQLPIPAYLDETSRAVVEARQTAGTHLEFMALLGRNLNVRTIDRQQLWNSLDEFEREAAVEAWRGEGRIALAGAEAWAVPQDPDWTEDPFHNVSWLSYYHSLAWLQAPGQLYRQDHDVAYRDHVANYLLDWIEENPRHDPPSIRSWYDHTVAWRTDTVVALFDPVLGDALDPRELDLVLAFLWQHGDLLHGYLSNPTFQGHNHNLFHALSLYNLALAFPEFRRAEEWKVTAKARIGTLFGEMVDPEGVSTEQAAGYHFLALSLFRAADAFLAAHGDPLSVDVVEVLGKMTEYAALLTLPDGTVPAYGDTRYGGQANRSLLADLDAGGAGSSLLSFMHSEGSVGERPTDLHVYEGAGYAIMRPSYGDAGNWTDDLHAFVDLGAWRRAHGHEDALNVLVWGSGGPLFVDSGGPYVYQNRARRDFVSAQAHNVVAVDGRGYDPDDLTAVDGQLLASGDREHFSFVDAVHDQWQSVSHRRTVIVIKPSILVIADRLSATSESEHAYELLWHLPPRSIADSSMVADAAWRGIISRDAGASVGMAVAASAPFDYVLVSGQESPGLGWVATGTLQRTPAPVLTYSLTGSESWFVTAVVLPQGGKAVAAPSLSASLDEENLVVQLSAGNTAWHVTLPAREGAGPTVAASEQ